MKRSLSVFLLLLAGYAQYAGAQQPVDSLNEQQRLGRQVVAQACGVCHLPPARNARTYGPALNKGAGGGDEAVVFSSAGRDRCNCRVSEDRSSE